MPFTKILLMLQINLRDGHLTALDHRITVARIQLAAFFYDITGQQPQIVDVPKMPFTKILLMLQINLRDGHLLDCFGPQDYSCKDSVGCVFL